MYSQFVVLLTSVIYYTRANVDKLERDCCDQPIAVFPSAVIEEPTVAVMSSITVARPTCPGGIESMGIQCDAKRPWPQCPPQSYCYASNSVDIGPYFCCPVWSTGGAVWRPASPSYPYYPQMPDNWPGMVKATANWGGRDSPLSDWTGQFASLMELLQARTAKKQRKSVF